MWIRIERLLAASSAKVVRVAIEFGDVLGVLHVNVHVAYRVDGEFWRLDLDPTIEATLRLQRDKLGQNRNCHFVMLDASEI
jgi:hypothetical protein